MELRHQRAPALSLGALAALLAGPTVLAFSDGGYFEGPRLVAAVGAWVLVVAGALTADGRGGLLSRSAVLALGGLAGLLGWAALSRSWAPLATPAGDDVQRDALYLGALLAAALLLRGPRRRARAVEPALALGTVVVIGFGLSGRLVPGIVHLAHTFSAGGRLEQPLTYWNATGALAAMGLVLCARLAGDRTRRDAVRAVAAAGAVPLTLGTYLSYSRGALAAAGVGLLVLSLLAPTWAQLRASALCAETGAAAAVVASRLPGVASLAGSSASRESDGVLMLSVLVALMIAAAAVQAYGCRAERRGAARLGPLPLRRGARLALWAVAGALALFPYAAALSERDANPTFGATAQRLNSVGSNRYAYWRVAARTALHHPVRGAGAASFRVEWLARRPFRTAVRDAHNLYLETLAELGLVGLTLLAALLAGVTVAARRVLRDDPALATGPAAALAVWALHAGVDWDWEMPALTLVAVLLAGLLLSRSAAETSATAASTTNEGSAA